MQVRSPTYDGRRTRLSFALSIATLTTILFPACARQASAPVAPAPAPAPVPTRISTAFDAAYGTAPAAGWKWGVAEITTGGEERIEDANRHGFAWMFYVVRGSTEVGTADGKTLITNGQALIVPAGQDHTHRFLPQSQVLVFRPADRPFGEFHRGTRLHESDAVLGLKAGQSYKARIREFTVSPGAESMTVDANWGYVLEGTLAVRAGEATTSQQTGKAFGLPSNAPQSLSNGGTTPVRFILVDLH